MAEGRNQLGTWKNGVSSHESAESPIQYRPVSRLAQTTDLAIWRTPISSVFMAFTWLRGTQKQTRVRSRLSREIQISQQEYLAGTQGHIVCQGFLLR